MINFKNLKVQGLPKIPSQLQEAGQDCKAPKPTFSGTLPVGRLHPLKVP